MMSGSDSVKTVVVIGGGLSGLSAANAINETANRVGFPIRTILLERDSWLGGKIRSVEGDGYLCETGPNGFLDNKPSTMALVNRLGVAERLYKSDDNARKRYVFSDGKLQRIPEDPLSFLTSELISIRGKLRLGMEFLLPQGDPNKDESVAEFVTRRLGAEALDKLIDPMSAGIYAGDPNVMSLKSCFPKVAMIEQQFGGLLRGMLEMQKMAKARGVEGPQNAGPSGVLWSFKKGTGEICDILADRIGKENVRSGVEATSLTRTESGWTVECSDGEKIEAASVVMATPAYDGAKLLQPHAKTASAIMENIPYVPTAMACLGYERGDIEHPLDGFGFLIPGKEGRKILGSLWSSSIFPNRAPEGKVMFTLIIGGARSPELVHLDDEALMGVCCDEMDITLGIKAMPTFNKITRWDRAIPQYVVGHGARVAQVEAELKEVGAIHLGGNAYYGIGINDCTARADTLAPEVLRGLGVEVVEPEQGRRPDTTT